MPKAKPTQYADVKGWQLSDSFWERIEPLLPKPKSRLRRRRGRLLDIGGRPRADERKLMTAILYTLRTGCQWNAIPKEYGSGKTANRYFLRWVSAGVFRRMWQAGLAEYDEVKGIAWKWQAADGTQTKAPLGGEKTGPNPTDRGKSGTKRSLLVDERGVPLAMVVSGANTPDRSLLAETLAERQVEAPADAAENLCLDKGYTGEPVEKIAQAHDLELHVPIKTNAKKSASANRGGGKRGVGSSK